MESVAAERDALKETLVKFTEEKEMLIVESEDTAQKLEKLHETKMRWVLETVKAITFKFIFRERSLFVTEDIGCLNCGFVPVLNFNSLNHFLNLFNLLFCFESHFHLLASDFLIPLNHK